MNLEATRAILEMRLRSERRTLAYASVAAAVVGFLAPHGYAGPASFCTLLGIVVALAQTPGRFPHLDLCERSAPLYGRQLARAKALVPCTIAAVASCAYAMAAAIAGLRDVPVTLLVTLAAVVPSTLTALSATIRTGPARALYVVIAAGAGAIALTLATVAHSIPGELAFSALASFLALRQYGEALARHDPFEA